jgi:hypothetical protein
LLRGARCFHFFFALPVPHTLQGTPSATPVALRWRHHWSIFLIWKDCISTVSLFDGAGCLLRWLFLLVNLWFFVVDIVMKKRGFDHVFVQLLFFSFVSCDANFVVIMSSTPPPPCTIASGI